MVHESLKEFIVSAYNQLVGMYPKSKIVGLDSPVSELLFINYLSMYESNKVEVGFHGTRPEVVKSIEMYGMLDSNSPKYRVANGNVYGKGIYVSPSLAYASGYGKGCLLSLLYIKGQVKDENPRQNTELEGDYTNPIESIIVLRSTAQVLPIFMVCTTDKSHTNQQASSFEDIENLFDVEYNQQLMSIANDIREQYDPNVRTKVVYNLLIREMKNDMPDTEKVISLIRDFDYSQY